jgi:hypothetical protein
MVLIPFNRYLDFVTVIAVGMHENSVGMIGVPDARRCIIIPSDFFIPGPSPDGQRDPFH